MNIPVAAAVAAAAAAAENCKIHTHLKDQRRHTIASSFRYFMHWRALGATHIPTCACMYAYM